MAILKYLTEYLGGGGYIQITLNAPRDIIVGGTTLSFKWLWARVDVSVDKVTLVFDTVKPLPTFSKNVMFIPLSGTINGLEITDQEIIADTSLGRHSIWSQK